MIEYPLEVAQVKAEERRIMARALVDFEMLLAHLRTCADCYNGACESTAHQIRTVQRLTTDARELARRVLNDDARGRRDG